MSLDVKSGRYSALQSGLYVVATNIQLEIAALASGGCTVAVAVNGNVDARAMRQADSHPDPDFADFSVSGVISMEAGDFVSVWVYAHEDTSYSVSSQSGFSCVLVETIEGFGADLASPQPVTSTAWTEVSNWEVTGINGRAGLFSLGSGFDPSSGRYTASVEGVYFASAQIRLDGADRGHFEMTLALDGAPEVSRLLLVTDGSPSPDIAGFSVGGVFKLEASDFLSVWVYAHEDESYTVSSESGFSGVLLTATARYASFAAAMSAPYVV